MISKVESNFSYIIVDKYSKIEKVGKKKGKEIKTTVLLSPLHTSASISKINFKTQEKP